MVKKQVIHVKGMHCAGCGQSIKIFLGSKKGVEKVTTSIPHQEVSVSYDPEEISLEEIEAVLKKGGYEPVAEEKAELSKEEQIQMWKMRTIYTGILLIPVAAYSYQNILGISLPQPIPLKYILFIFTTPIIYFAIPLFKSAYSGLKTRTFSCDFLMSMGIIAAYSYSVLVTFAPIVGGFYYAGAAMLIFFVNLGKWYQARVIGRTSKAIQELLELRVDNARVVRGGKEQVIPLEKVVKGDLLIVTPGEKIPTDGKVIEGRSQVDESMVTGESMPVTREKDDDVIGSTINQNSVLRIKATKIGEETVLFQIVKLVKEAQQSSPPIQQFADQVANYFSPAVLLIASIVFLAWFFVFGNALSLPVEMSVFLFAFTAAITTIIIACPCALGLAPPVAISLGLTMGAKNGILIKEGGALENISKVDYMVLDKTGTLTKGKPAVTDIVLGQFEEKELLAFAASAEKRSNHPLAHAVIQEAKRKGITPQDPSKFEELGGHGIEAEYQGKKVLVGNRALMKKHNIDIVVLENKIQEFEHDGKTAILIAVEKEVGILAVADTLKEKAPETIAALKKEGIKPVMLTGDNERTAMAIAKKLGIDEVLAEVLPEDKKNEIEALQNKGNMVAMVGDGINDAPAITQADVGIAIGSGTDVAMESGEIVLIEDNIKNLYAAVILSKFTLSKVKQNMFWALVYNTLAIPLAAGVFYPFFGWVVVPEVAAAAMTLSLVSVVGNSGLLLRHDKDIKLAKR